MTSDLIGFAYQQAKNVVMEVTVGREREEDKYWRATARHKKAELPADETPAG